MKKKKVLFILLALFLLAPVSQAQTTVEQLFKDVSKAKGIEHVNLGTLTMTFAGLFQDTMGVDGVEVLSLTACEEAFKSKFNDAVRSLKDKAYETMLTSNEEGERVKILVKLQDEMIRELVVVSSGNSPALIRIKGKIKPSDIERVIEKNK
ncbi:MAG: DUF4252 domain-containing protein [Tannerella sp.]|jgi:hypothetical protein|nr:DUF4252 domain-containing protein [Tannerella sp.]